MEFIKEFFLCDKCENKDFKRIYNFSLKFHSINFSDDLVYDRLIDEIYQCTKCQKTFTKDQIEEVLVKFKKKYKNKDTG
jgi:ribosomal protein L37AE/L43A